MKRKNDWDYNRFLKPICEVLTNHKHNKLIAWDASFSNSGYKYPNKHDFYYKCKICGYVFFNNHVSPENLKYIMRWDQEHDEDFHKE